MTDIGTVTVAAGLAMAGTMFGNGSYQRTTQMTGGAAAAMAGNFGGLLPGGSDIAKPKTETTMVYGSRMVTVTDTGMTIRDIDQRTMTTTDSKKREYSVVTLQQMQEMNRKFLGDMSKGRPTARPVMSS